MTSANIQGIHEKVSPAVVVCRDLSTRDDCVAVNALEREIWGPDYDEAVPLALLLVTAARGAILIGAFEGDRLIGFVYSLNCVRNGIATQWSYKLGVDREYRNGGLARRLKVLQRERAIEMGIDLIEWTFDPMLAPNAYLNLNKLGAIVHEYAEDMYGRSLAPIFHRTIPTDRLIASWDLKTRNVANRLSSERPHNGRTFQRNVLDDAVAVNRTANRGEWLECCEVALEMEAPRLMIEIPLDYSEMVIRAPAMALNWRFSVRQIFKTYLERGYSAVEFVFDPSKRKGRYLLVSRFESNREPRNDRS